MSRARIDSPRITCTNCGFMAEMTGTWKWTGGRLTFTADDDQRRRGPDLRFCGECAATFDGIEHEWNDADTEALRAGWAAT